MHGLLNNNNILVLFLLTVKDFGVKNVGKGHVKHLVDALQKYYKHDID